MRATPACAALRRRDPGRRKPDVACLGRNPLLALSDFGHRSSVVGHRGKLMFYFAYGSNMERFWFKKRCRGAKFVSAATLRDYDIAFARSSTMWGGGTADLKPTPGGVVEGVLWEIGEQDLKALDQYEGVPKDYIPTTVTVETKDGKTLQAQAYIVAQPGDYRPPSRRYMRLLIQGAEEHDLSDAYVMRLESIKTSG
ncbi:MAG: gamma-glutamylcyclotransferase family protein [candidate division NC10 bacterium]|jgi:cation transport regulator ChaC|nr:gamma-glutamylcyclotransferase [candidate division NC10 bacterium]